MNVQNSSFLAIPSPCGLAISSVTSDGEFLYALQPDRKTIYKLDVCGRIICIFKLSRRYTSIHYCSQGRFFATAETGNRIYILNKCFAEAGFIEPDLSRSSCTCALQNCCVGRENIFAGPAGDCSDTNCLLTIASNTTAYAADRNGRIIAVLGTAGRNNRYTAIAENNGILYEGLESTRSSQTYIRATLLSTGYVKVQRLPYGYRIRSFFCYGRYLYVFFTKNSFHGYVAPICSFISNGQLCGEIIPIPDSIYDNDCTDESCGGGCSNGCSCTSCTTCGVSSNQTDLCSDSAVSGDSTTNDDCDIEELCRLFKCIKKLCKNNSCQNGGGCNNSGCSSCVSGDSTSNGCCNGNMSCTCFPTCTCTDSDVDSDNCLPLPPCPNIVCCDEASNKSAQTRASTENAKVTFNAGK